MSNITAIVADSNPLTADEFRSEENVSRIDETLSEVLGMMLGHECHPDGSETPLAGPKVKIDDKTAIVGYAGKIRGACEIRMHNEGALAVATAMLGSIPSEDDKESYMCDAVGELCNMVAGGWKNRVPTLEASCSLAPPTVISGHDYRVHTNPSVVTITRRYEFSGHHMSVTLLYDTAA